MPRRFRSYAGQGGRRHKREIWDWGRPHVASATRLADASETWANGPFAAPTTWRSRHCSYPKIPPLHQSPCGLPSTYVDDGSHFLPWGKALSISFLGCLLSFVKDSELSANEIRPGQWSIGVAGVLAVAAVIYTRYLRGTALNGDEGAVLLRPIIILRALREKRVPGSASLGLDPT